MQVGYIVWTDNLLHLAVDTATRCGAVQSTTSPCNGTDMVTPANTVFMNISGVTFNPNSNCSPNSIGLIGTYNVKIGAGLLAVNFTLTATACYPIQT
jgi:hypothetical protein